MHGPNEGGPSPRHKNWSETTDTSFDSVIYGRLHKNVELNEKVENILYSPKVKKRPKKDEKEALFESDLY